MDNLVIVDNAGKKFFISAWLGIDDKYHIVCSNCPENQQNFGFCTTSQEAFLEVFANHIKNHTKTMAPDNK